MRFLSFISSMAVVLAVSLKPAVATESKYVEVQKPFANVYEFLDPKSSIIKQAKKGDHFELVYEGTSWYQVKISSKVGWLEKRAGEIVENQSILFNSMTSTSFVVFLLLLAGTLGGVSIYIYRQRVAEV